MKKFAKVSLIISVIIMFLGIIIYVIGFVGGGQEDVNRMVENGELSYFNGHLQLNPYFKDGGFLQVGWMDDRDAAKDMPEAPSVPEAPSAPEAPSKPGKSDATVTSAVMKGSDEASLASENVEKLVIELGGGELYIERGDVLEIQITTDCEDKFESFIDDNTLYVQGFDLEKNFLEWTDWDADRNSVHIILPKELELKKTSISLGAGYIEITDMVLGDTDMEVGAGEVNCRNTRSEQLSAELGAGAIYMEEMEAGESDINVAMGEAVLSGIFNEDLNLECSMGSIKVEINGKKEEFNYSVEAAMGSVEVEGNSYDGIAAEKEVDNGADKSIHAEAAMGDIEITFTK